MTPACTPGVEFAELLRAARVAVACGGTDRLAARARLVGALSRNPEPGSAWQAWALRLALVRAARLVAADERAGRLPAAVPAAGPLAPRLHAARPCLAPTPRSLPPAARAAATTPEG